MRHEFPAAAAAMKIGGRHQRLAEHWAQMQQLSGSAAS